MDECPICSMRFSDQDGVCPGCGTELGAASPPGAAPKPAIVPANAPAAPSAQSQPSPAPVSPAMPGSAGSARLTLRRAGALTNEVFPLSDHVAIGRFDIDTGPVDVDLGPLPEGAYLSRRHAELRRDGNGKWLIKDLGSQNGTFVRTANSQQFQRVVQEQAINDGDEIAFGNARFEFRAN